MHLVNSHTRRLEEVLNENAKGYAILSHRWEEDEVSFKDMQDPKVASNKKGFIKIKKSCELAFKAGIDYVWVDTCCINKDSSAELTEAINSMYRWYKASTICYAFLSDVNCGPSDTQMMEQQIKSSLWFTRGWTLQELLAPREVIFYNCQWDDLGTKQTLSKPLTWWTGIDEGILGGEPLSRRSIAQRMSWASQRDTTRIEDKAYCLLGIFDVNMPMLYGEGEKAFLRLQEEIIKQSDDHTIFAWPIHRPNQPGLLADSPAAFAKCQQMRTMTSRNGHSPYSLTNRGLSIKLVAACFKMDTYLVRLECVDEFSLGPSEPYDEYCLGMFLRRLDEDDQYARTEHEGRTFLQQHVSTWNYGEHWKPPVKLIDITVRQQCTELNTNHYKDRINGFRIATPGLVDPSIFGFPNSCWDLNDNVMLFKPKESEGLLKMGSQNRRIKAIKLGFDFDYHPVCFVTVSNGLIGDCPYDAYKSRRKDSLQIRGGYLLRVFNTTVWSRRQEYVARDLRKEIARDLEKEIAEDLEEDPGVWALKGDRITGLDVRLQSFDKSTLKVMDSGQGFPHLRIVRGELRDKIVWEVYLDNL